MTSEHVECQASNTEEPGARIPHAVSCEGGGRVTGRPTSIWRIADWLVFFVRGQYSGWSIHDQEAGDPVWDMLSIGVDPRPTGSRQDRPRAVGAGTASPFYRYLGRGCGRRFGTCLHGDAMSASRKPYAQI